MTLNISHLLRFFEAVGTVQRETFPHSLSPLTFACHIDLYPMCRQKAGIYCVPEEVVKFSLEQVAPPAYPSSVRVGLSSTEIVNRKIDCIKLSTQRD